MLSELWSDLRYRVRALVRRDAVERELEAELRFHLERQADEYERAGLPRREAMRRAQLAFGGVERVKEESRAARGTALLESLVQDGRYALRGLRSRPGFAAGVVLTLALGIGANAAMFGVLDRLLFRPPPYLHDADRVHRVYLAMTLDRQRTVERETSVGRFLDMRRAARTLSTVAGFATWHLAVGDGVEARQYPVAGVSAGYFELFDARPALGRFFAPREDSMPSGSPVAVLGHAYWASALGGRPDVLGRAMRVGRMTFTIIGVAPTDFVGLDDEGEVPAMYIPLSAIAWNLRPEDHARDYHWQWVQLAVKRAPGVSVAAATADLSTGFVRSRLGERPDDPAWARSVAGQAPSITLGPVQVGRGPLAGPETMVLAWVSGVALVVLLIACANVANLLLGRALARQREIALRLALGVTRGRLVRQLLVESLVLTAMGGGVGLAVAQWGGAVVRALFLPSDVRMTVLADQRTLALTLIVVVAAAVLTGLAPALWALRSDLARSLAGAGREPGTRRSGLRTALVIVQATLSVVLLVGAGLFVRSLRNVERLPLGYDADRVLVVTEMMRGMPLSPPQRLALERRLAAEARAMPGVVGATQAASVPFWGFEGRDLFVAGIDSVSLLGSFVLQAGNPDYFRVMGTRIVHGRAFDVDDRADAPRVTVVSAGMARALWPGQDPLGQCIRIDTPTAPCTTVVGVAADLHMQSLAAAHEYTYYVPIAQYGDPTGMLLVRVAGDAPAYAEPVRRWLQRVMPGAAYVTAAPLRSMIDPHMRSWRFGATMFVAFGGLALTLAGVGLYGVMAYGVAQRRYEIGIRVALGAPRTHIVALVVRGAVRLVIAGLALGSVIALGAGRWIGALLFDESATDPAVYGAVAAVLVAVALVATALPAHAAARVDPGVTLRSE